MASSTLALPFPGTGRSYLLALSYSVPSSTLSNAYCKLDLRRPKLQMDSSLQSVWGHRLPSGNEEGQSDPPAPSLQLRGGGVFSEVPELAQPAETKHPRPACLNSINFSGLQRVLVWFE